MFIICWYCRDQAYSDYSVAVCDKSGEPLHEPYSCDFEEEAKAVASRLHRKTGFPVIYDF